MSIKRILFITGIPGAGKTTLAKIVAKMLGCPHIDIDDHIRKLLGRVDTSVNTHSGINKEIGKLGHKMLFEVAEFWATFRPTDQVIFTVPMIVSIRQELLGDFCQRFQNQTQVVTLTLDHDTDEEVARRLADRKALGYVGGVDTIGEYRRVKDCMVPMSVPHTIVDTSPPRSIEICAQEVLGLLK